MRSLVTIALAAILVLAAAAPALAKEGLEASSTPRSPATPRAGPRSRSG